MGELIIRPMRDADRETLIDLKWEMNRSGPDFVGDHHDGLATDLNVTREGAAKSIARHFGKHASGEGAILVAELDGVIVGYMAFSVDKASASINEPYRESGHVGGLVVTEHARQKGIASRLLDEAERLTRERGLCRMTLGVMVGNDPAINLYRKKGFVPMSYFMVRRLHDAEPA
jgi:ribosomal protein S18 acetylase RimI-like enzyme